MRVQGQPPRWLEAVRLSPGANCDAMRGHVTHSHLRPLTGSTSSGTRVTRVNRTGGARKRTSCFQHQRRRGGEDACGSSSSFPPLPHKRFDVPCIRESRQVSSSGPPTKQNWKWRWIWNWNSVQISSFTRDEANLPPGALCAGECCRAANASPSHHPSATYDGRVGVGDRLPWGPCRVSSGDVRSAGV